MSYRKGYTTALRPSRRRQDRPVLQYFDISVNNTLLGVKIRATSCGQAVKEWWATKATKSQKELQIMHPTYIRVKGHPIPETSDASAS